MIFNSIYYHSLDSRNRLFVPSKFREMLGDDFVITIAPDECLYIYDRERFEEVSQQFINHPNRLVQRAFFGQSADGNPDKQGRVTLTAEQLKHAGITKEAVFVGAGKRIEIWAPEKFKETSVSMAEIDKMDTFIF